MSKSYTFAGSLFDTPQAVLREIEPHEAVQDDPETLALQASDAYGLTPEWMKANDIEASELVQAFADFIVDRPDRQQAERNFYLVTDGEAHPAWGNEEWDGIESVMCYATSAQSALEAANAYDSGLIQPTNVTVDGETFAALVRRVDGQII